MRIFEHRIFLSLLAGKFATIEQMLLTELVKKSIRQRIVQQLIKKKRKFN